MMPSPHECGAGKYTRKGAKGLHRLRAAGLEESLSRQRIHDYAGLGRRALTNYLNRSSEEWQGRNITGCNQL